MRQLIITSVCVGGLFAVSLAQPRQWRDDFTTAATYDSDSLVATCAGPAPSTKYTMIEPTMGDIYNDRAVSGGGRLLISSRLERSTYGNRLPVAVVGVLNTGQGCPDVVGVPTMGSTEPFSSPDVCIYGGISFTTWHTRSPAGGTFDSRVGADGGCGIAGVDDDLDGTIDEWNECLARRPTPVSNRYGNSGSNAYKAGVDTCPGACGVDEDGNGVVDDYGEIGWPGTDDGDDRQRIWFYVAMDLNLNNTSVIWLNIDPGAAGGGAQDIFSLREFNNAQEGFVTGCNEITPGFYRPDVHYNYTFCNSGTCYGAMLWTETDLANPDETIGPVLNSLHTGPGHNMVAFMPGSGSEFFIRQGRYLGNSNFSDSCWVISGSPAQYYPSPSPDLDDDRDVDGFDFLTFSNCYNGSNKPPLAACSNVRADLDKDGDVDGFDFLTFSNCYNGSNRRPLAACFPPNLTVCP
jgi:hypothetical protein